MQSDPHPWVEALTLTCRQIWTNLSHQDHFPDSSGIVREQVWLEICQSAFDVSLEAFSRIRKISNEGRANMSMDTQCLQYNLDMIHKCRPPRGKHYVDAFIRASYMDEEDLLAWIRENWQVYSYRHMHGLLSMTLSSVLRNKRFREAVVMLDELYDALPDDSSGVVGALMPSTSKMFEEGGSKISSFISKGFSRQKSNQSNSV